jgi:hypothetical protein
MLQLQIIPVVKSPTKHNVPLQNATHTVQKAYQTPM